MDCNLNFFLDGGLGLLYVGFGKIKVKVDSNVFVNGFGFFIYFILSIIICNDIEVLSILGFLSGNFWELFLGNLVMYGMVSNYYLCC